MHQPGGPGLVPLPASMQALGGSVLLTDGARVAADPVLRPAARWWRRVTEEAYGVDLVPVTDGPADV
ncbi:hypothetical protein, partial [Promicromonospora kroppenstedtii]|uniref:hypothetical protein n=1 Tax=Promicromonospora kroppenstedtii TaxID=440482 RepID=UPI00146FBB82